MITFDTKATIKVLKGPKPGECVTLSGETMIGRESHCNLVLPLPTVSRQHARIVRDAEGFFVQDLGSLNGTFVNSAQIADSYRLHAGDHIQIDEVLISFRQEQNGEPSSETSATADTKERLVRVPTTPPDVPGMRTTAYNVVNVLAGDGLRAEANPARKLEAFWEIMQSIGNSLEVDEVLPKILEALFDVFPQVDRGHVFLADLNTGHLESRAFRIRRCDKSADSTIGPRSMKIAYDVVEQGRPRLISAAQETTSVLDDQVRAMVCVPLVTPANLTIGALQLETEDSGRQFVAEDLELLATIGRLAAQLVEHARLHERRSMEESANREHIAVEREHRLLRAVLDILPVGVFIADSMGRILQVNPEAELIWGGVIAMSRDPRQYARDFPICSPTTGKRLRWQEFGLARALAGETVQEGEELRIETTDRRHKTILSYAVPIRDEQDQIIGAVWVIVDISDRKRAELIIRTANERKDKFLAVLAHELRNPLALVRSALALMGKSESDIDTAKWAHGLMDQQMEHMARLVDDLLDISRIAQGKIELRKETVELHKILVQAAEMVQPIIDAHRHFLHLSVPQDLIWIEADPVRMIQVFSNLLNNAVKYMQPEGTINMDAKRQGNNVEVCIRDTGIGIAEEELPHLFDPFTQAERARERSQGGLGIGLSLVRGIVQMHGGEVTAHSDGADKGSEFCVRLPVADPPLQAAEQQPQRTAAKCLRVLVVDDQVGQAQILAKLMSKLWDHDVQIAHDGASAIAAARTHRPDVILLDIDLPDITGDQVAKQLRGEAAFGETLIVALTGFGQEQYRQRTKEAGFDEHLVKPASVADLATIFSHPKLSRN